MGTQNTMVIKDKNMTSAKKSLNNKKGGQDKDGIIYATFILDTENNTTKYITISHSATPN